MPDLLSLALIPVLFALIAFALVADHLPRFIERLITAREANAQARLLEAQARSVEAEVARATPASGAAGTEDRDGL